MFVFNDAWCGYPSAATIQELVEYFITWGIKISDLHLLIFVMKLQYQATTCCAMAHSSEGASEYGDKSGLMVLVHIISAKALAQPLSLIRRYPPVRSRLLPSPLISK